MREGKREEKKKREAKERKRERNFQFVSDESVRTHFPFRFYIET